MIDLNDFILHKNIRKTPRYIGEVNVEKRYACYCEKCNNKRGYLKKSHYYSKKSKLCKLCFCSLKENREKARKKQLHYLSLNPPKRCPIKAFNNRLRGNLRNRLNCAIKGGYKSGSAVSDLGCTVEELKKHLENQFTEGMNWDNWGKKGWHIDHIIPLASFDLTIEEEFKKAIHYTNLQPLWAKDNLIKGNKLFSGIIEADLIKE